MSNDADEADFFTKRASPMAAATTATENKGSTTKPAPRASGWRDRIKPVHVFGGAFVLAAAWILGKPLLSGTSDQVTVSPAVDSATSRYFADPDAATSSARSAKSLNAATPTRADPVVESASAPVGQTSVAATSTWSSSEVDALRSQVLSLQAELAAVQATPSVCPPVASAASSATTAANTVKPTKPRVPRRPVTQDDAPGDRSVLSAYHLNTIYNGQAWIDGEQHTYVVEPGMSIDGMRIERIDATRRRVVTSQGEIR